MIFLKWKYWLYAVSTATLTVLVAQVTGPYFVCGCLFGIIAVQNEHWFD